MDIESVGMDDEDFLIEPRPKPEIPCNPCIKYQAPISAFLRPAQWIPMIRNLHRSEKKWRFQFPKTEEHLIIICEALEKCNLIIYQQKTTMYGFKLSAYSFSDLCGWLDVITLEVHLNDKNTSEVSVIATAVSTGLIPLIIPLSPLFNCLLCWFPFWDQGKNHKYLQNVWKSIHEQI